MFMHVAHVIVVSAHCPVPVAVVMIAGVRVLVMHFTMLVFVFVVHFVAVFFMLVVVVFAMMVVMVPVRQPRVAGQQVAARHRQARL